MAGFTNKTIIITGASGSLGSVLALNLAGQGAALVLVARDHERLSIVAKKCEALNAKVKIIQADITQEDQCQKMVEAAVQEYGKIDVLINNAAASVKKRFEDFHDLREFKALMDVNYYGSVFCTRAALPYLKATKGRIIGICSILGMIATPGNTAYCSSKFAMRAFFDVLRTELRKDGVSMTMAYPGYLAERMGKSGGGGESKLWQKIYSWLMIKADDGAKKIISAAEKRKRQVIIPFYFSFFVWVYFFMPGFFDSCLMFIINWIRKKA